MQPIIGITTPIDAKGELFHGRELTYIARAYAKQIRKFGGQPVLLDSNIDPMVAAKLCDGIVISGGPDIDPALYGQIARYDGKKTVRERSDWERDLIDACDTFERPVLGICYGMQLLNVHYGGTLCQDIKTERSGSLSHGSLQDPVQHGATFTADFLGYNKGDVAEGTHVHHQAVDVLAPGFTIVARAADDTIEAMIGHGHYAIQWHAELDDTAEAIYGEFIKRCQAQPAPKKQFKRPSLWTASDIMRRFKKTNS